MEASKSDILNVVDVLRRLILKNESCPMPEKIPVPISVDPRSIVDDYSIGYSCNLLNNSYLFCKIARKNGRKAFLFLEPNFLDMQITSLPNWEEVYFQGNDFPQSTQELPHWDSPEFVRSVNWDVSLQAQVSPAFEYEKLRDMFEGTSVAVDDGFTYLTAYSVLPHRDLLRLYDAVDILQVSGVHIGTASFSGKPYVTFPFGGDLYVTPFEDKEIGWMQARGFRKASRHIISGKVMMEYMETLGVPRQKIDLIPFMIDTDTYAPRQENTLRTQLREQYPGKILFLLGARQSWGWKGSDKLWQAVAKVTKKTERAVFLFVWYGQDVSRSQELIKSLGIEPQVFNLGVLSKEALRQYIDAVDVCVDQFTLGGMGTLALECMSCATPLITHYRADKHFDFEQPPPVLNAFSVDEIFECIMHCVEKQGELARLGKESREWVKRYHGDKVLWPAYDEVYRKALADITYRK